MTGQQETLILEHTKLLILKVREGFGLSLLDAMKAVYDSETFNLLTNIGTGEYENGSEYVYDDLRTELTTMRLPEEI